jgi:hypothetical protein
MQQICRRDIYRGHYLAVLVYTYVVSMRKQSFLTFPEDSPDGRLRSQRLPALVSCQVKKILVSETETARIFRSFWLGRAVVNVSRGR